MKKKKSQSRAGRHKARQGRSVEIREMKKKFGGIREIVLDKIYAKAAAKE
jgi:hypothetical protein